jgi:hypothetical protein
VHWFDQDSKELFKKNLKSLPEDWKYRNKKIKYILNKDGYRTKEFKDIHWAKSIVVFGCSYVFGIGNSEDETISGHIEKLTGIPTINMGAPGSSSLFSLHNSGILSAAYPKPIGIVFGWTSPQRCPLYLKDAVVHCGNWKEDVADLGKSWRRFNHHAETSLKITRLLAQELWACTKYYDFTLFRTNQKAIPDCEYIKQVDYSRDCAHSGTKTNEIIAKRVAESMGL